MKSNISTILSDIKGDMTTVEFAKKVGVDKRIATLAIEGDYISKSLLEKIEKEFNLKFTITYERNRENKGGRNKKFSFGLFRNNNRTVEVKSKDQRQ